jgi:hypothetical protein
MSMTILPGQPASDGPKQAEVPRAPKAPKGPRQRPELSITREHLAAIVAVVVLAVGGFLLWQHEKGSGSTPTAASKPSIPVYIAKPVGTTVPLPHMSAKAFLNRSLRSASRSPGVEATFSNIQGQVTISGRQVSGQRSGQQAFVIGSQSFEVRVVGATTYIRGTTAMLQSVARLPQAAAELAGDRWVVLHHGDQAYRSVTEGVLVKSSLSELALTGPISYTFHGQQDGALVISVRGTIGRGNHRGTATVLLQAHGKHLPISYYESGTTPDGPAASSAHFSHWGTHYRFGAPPGAVSFKTLVTEATA